MIFDLDKYSHSWCCLQGSEAILSHDHLTFSLKFCRITITMLIWSPGKQCHTHHMVENVQIKMCSTSWHSADRHQHTL